MRIGCGLVPAGEDLSIGQARAALAKFVGELKNLFASELSYPIAVQTASRPVTEPTLVGNFVRWPTSSYVAAKRAWNAAVRHVGLTPTDRPFPGSTELPAGKVLSAIETFLKQLPGGGISMKWILIGVGVIGLGWYLTQKKGG